MTLFIAQFKLDDAQEIEIAPRHHYDLMFKNDSPEKAKEIVYAFLGYIKS